MNLAPGSRIGPFEIVSMVGAGGMGEVYKARDPRLKRDVAVKVLPDTFAADAERLARFEREAEVLASLNHPHIAQIYGFEQAGATAALVMELVDGETLADRIARGPIPIDEALPIARQVGEALEAAHEQGIIHRDLKPANIKITPQGVVKVLDFGLAKLANARDSGTARSARVAPTITSPALMTHAGMLLGTAAYMAPEQAKGRSIDKRVDIWAYGAVLYEMLTGRPAFEGDNVTDVLAAVVRGDPDWNALPSGTPPSIRRLLVRCLTKHHKDRLPDIGIARLEIADATTWPDSGPTIADRTSRRHPLTRFGWLGALLFGIAATAIGTRFLEPAPPVPSAVHLRLPLPDSVEWFGTQGVGITISPDGAWIAYLGRVPQKPPNLFIRALNQDESRQVPDSELAYGPFFSPDSRQLGFTRDGKLWRLPVTGGTPIEIGPVDPGDRGTAWGSDRFIYSGGSTGISRISESGGTREKLTTVDPAQREVAHRFPAMVPGQPAVVFTVFRGTLEEARLAVLDLVTRKWTLLMDRPGHAPTVTPTGELLYLRGPVLMMASFDIARRVITGPVEAVLTGVDFNNGGAGHYGVSHTGVLTYTSDFDRIPQTTVQWATRQGDVQNTGIPDGAYSEPAVSRDGNRLALVIRERSFGSRVAVWDFTRASFTAQLQGEGPRQSPVWSADGMSLFFLYRPQGVGSVGRLFRQRTDATAAPEPLSADVPAQTHGSSGLFPASLSPDGQRLFFSQLVAPLSGIGMFNLATSTSELLLKESAGDPQISPDGRWLAYVGAAGPQPAIYIRPYPEVNRIRWTVSTGRGLNPRWSQDGKELLYINGSDVFSIPIAAGRDLVAGSPQPILKLSSSILGFAVHPDNRRFLLLQQTKGDRATPHVVLNWLQAQKRTAGATQR